MYVHIYCHYSWIEPDFFDSMRALVSRAVTLAFLTERVTSSLNIWTFFENWKFFHVSRRSIKKKLQNRHFVHVSYVYHLFIQFEVLVNGRKFKSKFKICQIFSHAFEPLKDLTEQKNNIIMIWSCFHILSLWWQTRKKASLQKIKI